MFSYSENSFFQKQPNKLIDMDQNYDPLMEQINKNPAEQPSTYNMNSSADEQGQCSNEQNQFYHNDDNFTPFIQNKYSDAIEINRHKIPKISQGIVNELNQYHSEHSKSQSDDKESQSQQIPCEDSFLDMIDEHLSNIKQEKSTLYGKQNKSTAFNSVKQTRLQTINISKQEITHCLLQNQSVSDSIQVTNLQATSSVVKLINSPFEFRLNNAKNKFIRKDLVQIQLQPYETVEIQFDIKRRQAEIGNIYETLTIQIVSQQFDTAQHKKTERKYLKFQITFIKPKLEVSFMGKTKVKRIQQHKIAQLQVYPNDLHEYAINLIFSQDQFTSLNTKKMERIECQIQAKGYISIHPSSVILYQNEPVKLVLRKLTQFSSSDKNSAILIRPLNSSLSYVIAVKCLDQRQKPQKGDKTNRFML